MSGPMRCARCGEPEDRIHGFVRMTALARSDYSVNVECPDCGATGLYSGFMEAPGDFVVCTACAGRGWVAYRVRPFTRRNGRRGVKRVRYGSGLIIDNSAEQKWFTYADFKRSIPSDE